ncbi:hypothetical protein PB1_16409 [Bacillus methanolicus PB1]|uniref:Uncharacterized protein n=1 Tax=Bacillus methanolicus PB1 TaxID=997296 RepID=I3DY36_BACMT|nr:hypothetical protein PB1_16409 [Bacillus methanolicus PB1]
MIISYCPDCGWEEWGIEANRQKCVAGFTYDTRKWMGEDA